MEDRKSTTKQVFLLGGQPITFNSLKQKIVALSSCEVKFMAINSPHMSRCTDCMVGEGVDGS